MIDFAKYAFNKSHAAAYAVVAYETAYLKHYYPVEFMAALMTSFIENSSKVSQYIVICKNMGIDILPPDINKGERDFSVEGGKYDMVFRHLKVLVKALLTALLKKEMREANLLLLMILLSDLQAKRLIKELLKAL